MPLGYSLFGRSGYAVRIDPSMKLHTSAVSLVDNKLEGIPERRGRFTAVGKIPAPWFELACVESVGLRPDLENHGVNTHCLEAVELGAKVCLVFVR